MVERTAGRVGKAAVATRTPQCGGMSAGRRGSRSDGSARITGCNASIAAMLAVLYAWAASPPRGSVLAACAREVAEACWGRAKMSAVS